MRAAARSREADGSADGCDPAVRRHRLRQPDVSADDRTPADGDPSEDRRTRVDRDLVFDDGVAVDALDGVAVIVEGEALGAERYALVDANSFADLRRLSNDYACTVVDEEVGPADHGEDQGRRLGDQKQVSLVGIRIDQAVVDIIGNRSGRRDQETGNGTDCGKDATDCEDPYQQLVDPDPFSGFDHDDICYGLCFNRV